MADGISIRPLLMDLGVDDEGGSVVDLLPWLATSYDFALVVDCRTENLQVSSAIPCALRLAQSPQVRVSGELSLTQE